MCGRVRPRFDRGQAPVLRSEDLSDEYLVSRGGSIHASTEISVQQVRTYRVILQSFRELLLNEEYYNGVMEKQTDFVIKEK